MVVQRSLYNDELVYCVIVGLYATLGKHKEPGALPFLNPIHLVLQVSHLVMSVQRTMLSDPYVGHRYGGQQP